MKALLFDLYGLFMHEQSAESAAAVEKVAQLDVHGVSREDFWHAYNAHRHDLDAGLITGAEYVQAIGRDLGVIFSDPQCVANVDAASFRDPVEPMDEWLREIHAAGWHPALLSNIHEPVITWVQQYDWINLFSPKIYSSEVGLAKPDPAIYTLAVQEINRERAARGDEPVSPADVLFFDDRQNNLDGAAEAGLATHLFVGLDDARAAAEAWMG